MKNINIHENGCNLDVYTVWSQHGRDVRNHLKSLTHRTLLDTPTAESRQ